MSDIKPIFILSLPRSGSTLLQKMLSADNDVASTAEPWILLPSLYALRKDGISAEYGHRVLVNGIEDFVSGLPHGQADYFSAIGGMMLGLYGRYAGNGEKYFLDKTPRYHLVAKDIMSVFPEAKIIVLWRNPLSVIASMIKTWGAGSWNIYAYKVDLYRGVENLLEFCRNNPEKICVVQYEDLVMNSDKTFQRIRQYIGLKKENDSIPDIANVNLLGRLGDPTGTKKYKHIEAGSVSNWQKVINNPLRRLWCKRYLRWLGRRRLQLMGYDYDSLLDEINSLPFSLNGLVGDIFAMSVGVVHCLFEPAIIKKKLRFLREFRNVFKYS